MMSKNRVLFVGDSMIKHIDERKIERAFGGKATCHSYGGATACERVK